MSNARELAQAKIFFALGDVTRLSVLRNISSKGALSASALAVGSHVSRQAIAKHLRVLERARLVGHEKRGREVLYALRPERFDDVRAFLDAVSARWDRALERLRSSLEEPDPETESKK
ncbi:MAG TPA: metalloregulator ArsR/SmtB family transcription factor [Polyangiaceae bacterium]|jgi:DNA-binding transcriptional ArsR family regulator|nr:metalloregulator ArsR/SmtB family transcription factor [Polyangiaceae bacterium]